jgi:hypothetical protein
MVGLQTPAWPKVPPRVWQARLAVGEVEVIREPAARTRPRFEASYPSLVRRALAGERVVFPADLTAPALTHQAQLLTEAARADAHRRALELSRSPTRKPGGRHWPRRRRTGNPRSGTTWRGAWRGRRGGNRAVA